MTLKLNCWYIQEVWTEDGWRFQPVRFLNRKGDTELGEVYLTLKEARDACNSPFAVLI